MALLVNGERIEDNMIQGEVMRMMQARGMGPGTPPQPEMVAQARENSIARTLLRQEANKSSETVEPVAIEAGIEDMFREAGGEEGFFKRYRMTEADMPKLRAHVVESIRVQRLIESNKGETTEPTDEEVRAFYDVHKEDFNLGERVRAAHIVRRPTGPDDRETFAKMVAARKRLKSGEDFAKVADEFTECQSEPGGDLGLIARGQMVEGFEVVAFSMDIGEISPVIQTQFGYHVVTVTAREEPRQQEFEEVKEMIYRRLKHEREDGEIKKYVEGLKLDAEIEEIDDSKSADGSGKKGKKNKQSTRKK